MMPEMDGIETFHRLKKEVNGQSVPVIALTADVIHGNSPAFSFRRIF